jgi:hypothetical protein
MKKLTALLLTVILIITACTEQQENIGFVLSPQNHDTDESTLHETIKILTARLISAGITQGYGFGINNGVIELVFISSSYEINDIEDLDAIIEQITQVGELTFRHNGEIVLTGKHVKRADPMYNQHNNSFEVSLVFTEEGGELFYEITTELAEKNDVLEIWVDDNMISAPMVSHAISNGNASINGGNGGFTHDEAKALADKIDSGALPYRLGIERVN